MSNMTTHYNVEPMEVEAEAEDEVRCNIVRIFLCVLINVESVQTFVISDLVRCA